MIYMLYDLATGAARSVGSSEPPRIPDGMGLYVLREPYATLSAFVWDAPTRRFVAAPPATDPIARTLTRREYRGRYTMQEKFALKKAATGSPDPDVRAQLQVLEDELLSASNVNLDDPDTILGANATVDVLVALGVVPVERRNARVAELLQDRTDRERVAAARETEA